MKRKTTEQERQLFQSHVATAFLKPKAAKSKPSKLGRDLPPPRGEAAGGGGGRSTDQVRRPEGVKIDGNTAEKLRRGQLAPGARIDLHGMTESAAHRALQSFLVRAQNDGVRLALVITGVGNPQAHEGAEWMRTPHGVLKEMVPRWLNEKDFVGLTSGWARAHRRHGGDGALYVYLRRKK
ncbi:MAG TPA: Smr/MutS family protein [Rhizomicrobium sp.]|jgi:DNA-nicking Smr family endonuclease|nr:Smr/MutS family protein [Rhizomicrobium sp.]